MSLIRFFQIILFIVFCFIACKDNQGKTKNKFKTTPPKLTTNQCLVKKDKERILETIMNTHEFKMFLHPEIKNRLPIELVINDFVTSDLELEFSNQKVEFKDSLSLPLGKQHRIRIIKKDCQNWVFKYSLFYPIEGVIISGNVQKNNNNWIATETTWGEKN